jgi:acyl-CoA synthetase (AMP-forming)/AMP-acid ligase II
MHLVDVIQYWARTEPNRPALLQPELATTYQGLAEAIESISDRIEQLGLARHEPIAVSLTVPSYFLATVLAVLHSGYSAVLVNPARYPFLSSAGIRNLIYDTEGQMLSGGRNIRFDKSWLPSAAAPKSRRRAHRKPAVETGNVVLFTSGTTGLPKKVVQASSALDQLLKYPVTCASGPYQKILVIPGLTSTLGFNRACEILSAGKTACFAPESAAALALIGLFDIEVVVASAAQALLLAELKSKVPGYRTESLKTIFVGGSHVAPAALTAIRTALCRNVLNQYGSTEAGVVTLTPFESVDDASGGYPLPWVELEITDETGAVLPAGAEGVIRYRTPQLIENLEVAGPGGLSTVRDGWFYPGDVGSVTEDGVLRLSGRTSDVINRGGVKVSGNRIEEILQELPEIDEAAACGVSGPSGLEELWIAVVANGAIDTDKIKDRLRQHADVGLAPDQVFLVDTLPRGELGKVQKFRLKEMLLSRTKVT